MKKKVLTLTISKRCFDMILSGEKTEEYRMITTYWYQRLYQRKPEFAYAGRISKSDAEYACDPDLRYILTGEGFKDNELRPYTHILFRYGYTRRTMLREIESITIGRGNPKWCAPTDKDVFIIKFS